MGVMIVGSAMFLFFSIETRNVALMNGEHTQSTLDILLSWNHGGYSPYVKESWGKTGPEDDMDWDGIKNAWDPDADNDMVEDLNEYPTRFNPFQPDIGISDVGFKWVDEDTIKIYAQPVEDITGVDFTVTLYLNDKIQEYQQYEYLTNEMIFIVDIDPDQRNIIEVRSEGTESEYANKANNLVSYTIAAGAMGSIGQIYYDLENEVQGVIRNSPLFQSNDGFFSAFENLLRNTLAGVPLLYWIIIILIVFTVLVIRWRRQRKGKRTWFAKKKNRDSDVKIQLY